jgi:hypothetical protein
MEREFKIKNGYFIKRKNENANTSSTRRAHTKFRKNFKEQATKN